MRRRLFCVVVWLGMLSATAALADFRGVDNARIHVTAPPGYCLLAPSDPRYTDLRDSYEGRDRKGWVRAIFGVCTPPGHRPLAADVAGYIVALPQDPTAPTPDARRSKWVRSRTPPRPSDWTDIGIEQPNDGAYYFHAIRSPINFAPADTRVEATAETVIRDTPVEVTIVRLVPHYDIAASGLALDEARTLRAAAMKHFGEANGVDFVHPISDEQAQAAVELALAVFVDVVGAILMITLAVPRLWVQAAIGAVLGGAGVLIYRAAPGAGVLLDSPIGDVGLWALAAVGFVGIANGMWWLLERIAPRGVGLTSRLRGTISARTWPGATDPEGAAADFTKRWFVAVAAATGSVVVSMLGREGFLAELTEAFGPGRIIFTLLATVVSVTLIGPVEDFIFGSRMAITPGAKTVSPSHHAEEVSRFEQLLALVNPRALGRFALVMVFMLMLTVMHGAIEARVHDSKSQDITVMLAASVGPALITYYWCAALQRGLEPLARRAGIAAAVAGLLVLGIPNAILTIVSAASVLITKLSWLGGDHPARQWGAILIGAPLNLVTSFGSLGAIGLAGGLIIDLSLRRRLSPLVTVGLVGAALVVVILLFQLIAVVVLTIMLRDPDPDRLVFTQNELLAVAGWVLGLIVSGFPTVLRSRVQFKQAANAD